MTNLYVTPVRDLGRSLFMAAKIKIKIIMIVAVKVCSLNELGLHREIPTVPYPPAVANQQAVRPHRRKS